ncbi:MAG: hypothetical protein ACXWV1_13675 [Chitinophagaceae bacterium]
MNRFVRGIIPIALLAILIQGCNPEDEMTIKNYNLGKPDKFYMPESLLEISGIAFYKGKSDTVYGIQDEQGRLFRLAWGEKKTKQFKIR